jgi:histidinol-phosphate phosphatase family protein
VVLVEGAADAVARGRQLGYAIVVVSNQSGVARGFYTEEDVHSVNRRMEQRLRAQNPAAVIDHHEFCPFHPEAVVDKYRHESDLRKPRPGMLLAAARALDVDLPRSWMIGDAPRDIAAGHAAGCRTILLHDPALPPSPAAGEKATVRPDHVAASLAEAIRIVELG